MQQTDSIQLTEKEHAPEPQRSDFLSQQFNRLPYKLYKCWLILSFAFAVYLIYVSIGNLLFNFQDYNNVMTVGYDMVDILRIIGSVLMLFGSTEMLFAISKRRSKVAQKGLLKFQYSVMASVMSLLFLMMTKVFFQELSDIFLGSAVILPPLIHLLGGFAVLNIFKKNHPLAKAEAEKVLLEEDVDSVTRDFRQQNEAIAFELSKYDEQLNRRGYLAFRWWLKFVIIFEAMRVCRQILTIIGHVIRKDAKINSVPGLIVLSFLFFLSACSAFETEVGITIKALKKVERAILCLKVCSIVSIGTYFLFGFGKDDSIYLLTLDSDEVLMDLISFLYCCMIPIVTLIGALKVRRVIEQREKFAQISSWNNESYI